MRPYVFDIWEWDGGGWRYMGRMTLDQYSQGFVSIVKTRQVYLSLVGYA